MVPSRPKSLTPLYWGIIVTIISAAAITLATYWAGQRAQGEYRWVRHTLAIRNEFQLVQTLLLRAESSQRGYLLTGRDAYLALYEPATLSLLAALNRAVALGAGTGPGSVSFGELRRLIGEKLKEMQSTIAARKAGDAAVALAIVNNDGGHRSMEAVRSQLSALVAAQDLALEAREGAAASFSFFLQLGSVAVFLLICGAGVLVGYYTRRAVSAIHTVNDQLSVANRSLLEQISQRERVEDQLRQAQKMEAVGHLTGGIAHDFNNMLGVVTGALDLMRRRLLKDEYGISRFIEAAMAATERSAALTQRLLAFARMQPLSPEPVDANRMISNMSDLLRSTLGEQTQIETVLAAGLWKTNADVNQLEGALLNVAINARDAMPEGGKLTIETANIYLDEEYCRTHSDVAPGQFVLLAVTDEGGGMTPQVSARAFDPFFTTKPQGKGTGLGLSQVYGFVKQSLGHIKIYSEIGTGTTVKIYLPRLHGQGEEVKHAAPQVVKGGTNELVLVVEDDPLMRRLSVDSLRELGYAVLESEGAAAALVLLDQHPEIKLLFTDVVMPEMDGKKLAVAALRRRPDLKVLFTTGYTRNAVVHGGILDPDVRLLSKPFTLHQLAGKVREALDAAPSYIAAEAVLPA